MTTTEIRQLEAGALAFGQKTYGDDLADAMYLGTFNSIHYLAQYSTIPIRVNKYSRFSLPMQMVNIAFCLLSSLNCVLTQTERRMSGGNTFGGS